MLEVACGRTVGTSCPFVTRHGPPQLVQPVLYPFRETLRLVPGRPYTLSAQVSRSAQRTHTKRAWIPRREAPRCVGCRAKGCRHLRFFHAQPARRKHRPSPAQRSLTGTIAASIQRKGRAKSLLASTTALRSTSGSTRICSPSWMPLLRCVTASLERNLRSIHHAALHTVIVPVDSRSTLA